MVDLPTGATVDITMPGLVGNLLLTEGPPGPPGGPVPAGGANGQVVKMVAGIPAWAADTDTDTTYAIPSQAEAEAGTATTARAFSAERVKQAIDALGPEMARDTLGAALVQGTGITLTVSDAGNTITLANTSADTWTAYTPTWTTVGTAPALGNGSWAGSAYLKVGKRVDFRIVLTAGSTTTFGTGDWSVTLPFAPASTSRQSWMVDCRSAGGANHTAKICYGGTGTTAALLCPGATSNGPEVAVTNLAPYTWSNGATMCIVGSYEAAA